MDLRRVLADAGIRRVAIVDDDLSSRISTRDLQRVDGDLEALLADPHDPDRLNYIECLRVAGFDLGGDLAQPLSDPAIRAAAPERLRHAAEQVLEARQGNAAPLVLIRQLLIGGGIDPANIDTYFDPQLPAERRYDLLIVDYYLVNDATEQTVPFLKSVVAQHEDQEHPVQLVLMSSHEQGLQRDFRQLRPAVGICSSRLRILAKPREPRSLAAWTLTLAQLGTDRRHVLAIELFVRRAISAFERAALQQSRKLWELDLQAMKLLHDTAQADHDDYARYVEECLSRYLLTQLEAAQDLRGSLGELSSQFDSLGATADISSGAEIGDSRAAVRELMTSMVWRGSAEMITDRCPEEEALRPTWVQRSLRFGMVLRDPAGRLWLNLTQICDLAQATPEDLPQLSLLLMAGTAAHLARPEEKSNSKLRMPAPIAGAGSDLITWHLRQIATPTVLSFANSYANGWAVLGELRLDQAQSVVSSYGAQATRVGLQRPVRSWAMSGVALTAGELNGAAAGTAVQGYALHGQALQRGKEHELHFDLATYSALQQQFPGAIDEAALRICQGVLVKPGKSSPGTPHIVHCMSAPTSVDELRTQIGDPQLLNRAENAGKVVLAVWGA